LGITYISIMTYMVDLIYRTPGGQRLLGFCHTRGTGTRNRSRTPRVEAARGPDRIQRKPC